MEDAFGLARVFGRGFPGGLFGGARGPVAFSFGGSSLLRLARTAVLLALFVTSPLTVFIATSNATNLPDGRAYELVSPPDKNGGDIVADSQRTRAAADGSALGFISLTAFGDPLGTGVASDYISVRSKNANPGSNGWSTHSISPLQDGLPLVSLLGNNESHYVGEFTDDLSTGATMAWSPLTDEPNVAAVENLYRRVNLRQAGPGDYQLLSGCPLCAATSSPLRPISGGRFPALATEDMRPYLAGASPSFEDAIFESRQNLTSDAPAQPGLCSPDVFGYFLCETRLYEWVRGTVRLAGILPDGTAAEVSIAGAGAGGNRPSGPGLTPHTISDGSDGHSRIFFTAPTDSDGTTSPGEGAGNLYVRTDGTMSEQLNLPERGDPDAFAPALYLDASRNGERVFFMTSQALTGDAPMDGQPKIYMYDTTKPGSAPDNLTYLGSHMVGMIGASDDGHYAYLVNHDTITLWHDGATVDFGPVPAPPNRTEDLTAPTAWFFAARQARVTPDGKHMVYRVVDDDLVEVLYSYDADTNQVTCVSCPGAASPTADASTAVLAAAHGGTQQSWHQNRAISDDGSRVFFSTSDALVPEDTNGRSDAYEYSVPRRRVFLLSTGKGQSDSWFLDASRNGDDAFFVTRDRLVGWDSDGAYDVYDARVGGGFPEPPRPPQACAGDACQGALNLPPAFDTPPSVTVSGLGNVKFIASKKTPKHLTDSQKLKKALRACKGKHSKAKRKKCESSARRRFGKSGGSK
jgi:hypothetical protein